MPESQGDPLPTPEIDAEAYQSVKSSVEQGDYTNLICSPEEGKKIVDKLVSELAESHTTMRVTVPEKGRDFPGVVSDFESIAPDEAKGRIKKNLKDYVTFPYYLSTLMEKCAQVSEKPLLAIIENVQYVTDARDDLLGMVRGSHTWRHDKEGLTNMTFLLVADRHPTDLYQYRGDVPSFNIGTNIRLRS